MGWHFSPRYFAVKTQVDDSQYSPCNQSDTREWTTVPAGDLDVVLVPHPERVHAAAAAPRVLGAVAAHLRLEPTHARAEGH
jgi:hypothetical protein